MDMLRMMSGLLGRSLQKHVLFCKSDRQFEWHVEREE